MVISEGFPRDSITMPIERVKNVVSFSFQHAPLGMLYAPTHMVSQPICDCAG